MFVEGEKVLIKNDEIAEEFGKYFENVINDLDLYEFSSCPMEDSIDEINSLKQNFNITEKLSFKEIWVDDIETVIRNTPTNKTSGEEIPLQILKNSFEEYNFNFEELKKCVDYAILSGKFPDCLKLADVTPVHHKEDPTDKSNIRPVSVLSLISKVFERVISGQFSDYMDRIP